jgi:GNAT superfamily N-acetyltransferase
MPSFSDPRIVCRPALPSDTPDVLTFTSRIWEGRDYIHLVWDEWLADPQGLLVSAQFGPRVVGIAKVSPVFPGQWWLHGLRVDPDFQGLKIGSHLHEYSNAWWLRHGDGVIRLLTSTERVQVHHLCERTGYARVGEITQYRRELADAAASAPAQNNFQPVENAEIPAALAFAAQHLPYNAGLMDTGWRFVLPDPAVLARFVSDKHLHCWRDRDGLLATWEGDDDDYAVLGIGFAAVREPALLPDLLRDAVALASGRPVKALFWLAPAQADVVHALEQAGYTSDDDYGALFEKHHPDQ